MASCELLPIEVLAHTFTILASEQDFSSLKFPIDLSQIQWLHITVTQSEYLEKAISFLRAIHLTSIGPLSIYLYWGIENNTIGSLILPLTHQLEKFDLRIHEHACYALADLPPESFHDIVDFAFFVSLDYSANSGKLLPFLKGLKLFKFMKHLRKLQCGAIAFQEGSYALVFDNPYIPYHQLTHLDLQDVFRASLYNLIPLLRKCTLLQSLLLPSIQQSALSIMENEELLPKLTSVQMDEDLRASVIPMPWRRLTQLTLIYMHEGNMGMVLDVLEKTTCLEHLTLRPYLDPYNDQGDRMITLTHLRTLTVSPEDYWAFSRLIVPQLRELYVYSYQGDEDHTRVEEELKPLYTRSGCTPRIIHVAEV
ncbi:hypothetical protein H0H92_015163 [Tricholoma furcatifolium]|nr:hypothetical protein H0H92_015163 [Tricholoma furcatifolium]